MAVCRLEDVLSPQREQQWDRVDWTIGDIIKAIKASDLLFYSYCVYYIHKPAKLLITATTSYPDSLRSTYQIKTVWKDEEWLWMIVMKSSRKELDLYNFKQHLHDTRIMFQNSLFKLSNKCITMDQILFSKCSHLGEIKNKSSKI